MLGSSLLRATGVTAVILIGIVAIFVGLTWSSNGNKRSADGLTAYLGMTPAAIVKGRQTMHGGTSNGPHEYHLDATIFDATNAARVSDAKVTAKVLGIGVARQEARLEPMNVAAATTYGGFIYLPGVDVYTIELAIQRSGYKHPVILDFSYDHRQ